MLNFDYSALRDYKGEFPRFSLTGWINIFTFYCRDIFREGRVDLKSLLSVVMGSFHEKKSWSYSEKAFLLLLRSKRLEDFCYCYIIFVFSKQMNYFLNFFRLFPCKRVTRCKRRHFPFFLSLLSVFQFPFVLNPGGSFYFFGRFQTPSKTQNIFLGIFFWMKFLKH